MKTALQDALDRLEALLSSSGPVLLAVSGGVDSRFLAFMCARAGVDTHCVHFAGPHMNPDETRAALGWLADRRLPAHLAVVNPLKLPEVAAGDRERCYHCKRMLFEHVLDMAVPLAFRTVWDGSNADDMGSGRPGLKALRELGIRSPLAEAGMTKDMIRQAALTLGLDDPGQPSRPCLLTRVAYGVPPEKRKLEAVARAESGLAGLGLERFRLRLPAAGGAVLHLDVSEEPAWGDAAAEALELLRAAGFDGVEVHFTDTLSGHFDRR